MPPKCYWYWRLSLAWRIIQSNWDLELQQTGKQITQFGKFMREIHIKNP